MGCSVTTNAFRSDLLGENLRSTGELNFGKHAGETWHLNFQGIVFARHSD
jgi:hypothetical protein